MEHGTYTYIYTYTNTATKRERKKERKLTGLVFKTREITCV